MELGGKHAAIVLADSDLEKVCGAIVWGAFTNAGQACASIERVYVAQELASSLVARVSRLASRLRLGDGLNPATDVGPQVDEYQLQRIESLVTEAKAAGAQAWCGGKSRRDLGGYFYEPTVLAKVDQQMRIAREEIFGPVLPIIVVESGVEAVRLSNDSNLGL